METWGCGTGEGQVPGDMGTWVGDMGTWGRGDMTLEILAWGDMGTGGCDTGGHRDIAWGQGVCGGVLWVSHGARH